jgi:hypothetical protein
VTALFTVFAFLRSPFGKIVGAIVLAALVAGYIYTKGYHDGSAHKQGQWDVAVVAGGQQAADARERSERDTPPLVPEPPAPGKNCTPDYPRARNDGVLVDDPFNRIRRRK